MESKNGGYKHTLHVSILEVTAQLAVRVDGAHFLIDKLGAGNIVEGCLLAVNGLFVVHLAQCSSQEWGLAGESTGSARRTEAITFVLVGLTKEQFRQRDYMTQSRRKGVSRTFLYKDLRIFEDKRAPRRRGRLDKLPTSFGQNETGVTPRGGSIGASGLGRREQGGSMLAKDTSNPRGWSQMFSSLLCKPRSPVPLACYDLHYGMRAGWPRCALQPRGDGLESAICPGPTEYLPTEGLCLLR